MTDRGMPPLPTACIHIQRGEFPRWSTIELRNVFIEEGPGEAIRAWLTVCPLCSGYAFGMMIGFATTGIGAKTKMADVDLDKIETDLKAEAHAYALEIAAGDYSHRDNYDRVAERLKFVDIARGHAAHTRPRTADAPTPHPHTPQAANAPAKSTHPKDK